MSNETERQKIEVKLIETDLRPLELSSYVKPIDWKATYQQEKKSEN